MRLPLPAFTFTALIPPISTGKTIDVAVGQHGLHYDPSTIIADLGDDIRFSFYNVHSVVQSAPDSPCQPLEGGIYSGVIPSCFGCGASPQRFLHTVKDREPLWFYCGFRGHCNNGMVGVINPPVNGTLADYDTAARETDPGAPQDSLNPNADAPIGGVFLNVTSSASSVRAAQTSTAAGLDGSFGGGGGMDANGGQAPFENTARTLSAFPTPYVVFDTSSSSSRSLISSTDVVSMLPSMMVSTASSALTYPSSTFSPTPTSATSSIAAATPSSRGSRMSGTAFMVIANRDLGTWSWYIVTFGGWVSVGAGMLWLGALVGLI